MNRKTKVVMSDKIYMTLFTFTPAMCHRQPFLIDFAVFER